MPAHNAVQNLENAVGTQAQVLDLAAGDLEATELAVNKIIPSTGSNVEIVANTYFTGASTTFATPVSTQAAINCEDEIVLQSVGTVAAAGSVLADAGVESTNAQSIIVTDANGTKGVRVWTNAIGDLRFYANQSASTLKIYPASGGTINNGGAGAAYTAPANSLTIMICLSATGWWALST